MQRCSLLVGCLLLLCSAALRAQPTVRYHDADGRIELLNPPALTALPKASGTAAWGIHLWEFGDGHFSFNPQPRHPYARAGTYRGLIHLTPFYAANRPARIPFTLERVPAGRADYRYNLDNRWTRVETNANRYIVPGHDLQAILHYQLPPGTGSRPGHLFLFYQKNDEFPAAVSPLTLTEERPYYDEQTLADPLVAIEQRVPVSARETLRGFRSQFGRLQAWRTGALAGDEQRRLFLTLHANPVLSRYQDKNRGISLKLVWVPDDLPFDARRYVHDYAMQILAVHDPNRIRVTPRTAYFHRRHPKTLRYDVDFQNKAEGAVQHLRVALPLDASLDAETVKVLQTDPPCAECPVGVSPDTLVCYRQQLKPALGTGPDSLVFTFFNVGLEGTRSKGLFENRSTTRGSIVFTINSNEQRVGSSRQRAYITFAELKPIPTGQAVTSWRRKGVQLRAGLNFGLSGTAVSEAAEDLSDRLAIGVGYFNQPLQTGISYGWGLHYAGFRVARSFSEVSEISPDFTLTVSSEERARLHYLEAEGWLGYQIGGFLHGVAGLGLSMPALGRVTVDATATYFGPNDPEGIPVRDRSVAEFGLLGGDAPLDIFEQTTTVRHGPGLLTYWGLEVGLQPHIAVGGRYEVRYYPRFYCEDCSVLRSLQAYLRVELFPVGSRSNRVPRR